MTGLEFNLGTAFITILLGFMTAVLEGAFQHYMGPDMVFEWYGKLLYKLKLLSLPIQDKEGNEYAKPNLFFRFIGWIIYPLGYCPYCNGTWITIILFIIIFGISINLLFSIGTFWLFYRLIDILKIRK